LVKDGDRVKIGQVLLKIESSDSAESEEKKSDEKQEAEVEDEKLKKKNQKKKSRSRRRIRKIEPFPDKLINSLRSEKMPPLLHLR
jgi:multidrug efflux pump subunit AcrA (membrane-fusion protein)